MTFMSGSKTPLAQRRAAKPRKNAGRSWWTALAPRLHRLQGMAMLSALATGSFGGVGCILPEDLHSPQEHAPRIVPEHTQPPPDQVFSFPQSATSGPRPTQTFSTIVIDPDEQELRTRAFVDGRYDRALALNNDRVDSPPRGILDGRRGYFFDVEGLCDDKVNRELGRHVLELYVSDSGFVGRGSDLRQPNAGGLRDSLLWVFNCIEPLPPALEDGVTP
ncbi:MAG: hypothetical protein IPL40_04985 [Proteobacteria bacterium]|nr:hypothetical protein [Pseudomonadota bacterium]